ncbi:MAG: hypothetical protein IJH75_00195 [Mogibacterium sp.]|nr:hypothetical protein [Mogibacterium sp.]
MTKLFKDRKKKILAIILAEGLAVVLMLGLVLSSVAAETEEEAEPSPIGEQLTTELNVKMIEADLDVSKNAEPVLEVAKAEKERQDKIDYFLDIMNSLGHRCASNNFKYGNAGSKNTYSSALHSNKLTNCARFVSWGMQELGVLPYGKTFWLDSGINGNATSIIKNSSTFEVYYPKTKTSNVDLQPGDILGYKLGGGQHTMIYAGRDANGNRLYYSAGGGDVSSKSYGPKAMNWYNGRTLHVLIRINWDNVELPEGWNDEE